MNYYSPSTDSSYEEIVLDRMKYAAQAHLSGHALHSLDASSVIEHFADGLVFRLTTEVLGHRQPPEVSVVPFTQNVDLERPAPRAHWWPFAVSSLFFVGISLAFASVWIFLLACLFALVGVCVLVRAGDDRPVSTPVSGAVEVQRDTTITFPEIAHFYPPDFGRPVVIAHLRSL